MAVAIKTMKEQLEAKGWKMYYECTTCSGHKQYFTNNEKPKYEVMIILKNQTFSILYENHLIAGPFWAYQLDEKLLKHVV